MARKLLGQILVEDGVIGEQQVEEALRIQEESGVRIGQALLRLGYVKEDELSRALAKQAKLPFVDLSKGRIAKDVIDIVPADLAEEYGIIPIKVKGSDVIVALADPLAAFNLENLRFLLNRNFKCAVATESGLSEAFKKYYSVEKEGFGEDRSSNATADDDDEAPIIRLVDKIIEDAVKIRASDIHLEPSTEELRVRYRVDGVCKTVARHARHLVGPVISRMKIMAGMDISEKRKPQDGRIMMHVLSRDIDMRVSSLPSLTGESVVCRILDKVEGLVSLEKLGFSGPDLGRFEKIITRPNGIFLVTGPTGSGKTTTLYAALKTLNQPNVKIITAENPVEYHLKGINQCQVKHSIGLDFARILRSMLRQAPNIILVGEIRDAETAGIAIQAALTGHLVFSTLHTNDAPSAITRLADMGVAPFLISTSVVAVLAQRLIRTLCEDCKEPYTPTSTELSMVGLDEDQVGRGKIYRAKGCAECGFNGYSGRIGIFELMEMDSAICDLTFAESSHMEIRNQAVQGGMATLRADGVRKIVDGLTSVEEILRVVSQEVMG